MTRNQKQNNGGFAIDELKRQMARRRKLRLAAAVLPLSGMLLSRSALAATGPDTWVGNTDATWQNGANWSGTNAPPASGDSLVFNADGTAGTANSDTLTNTLTSTAFNVAGITFGSNAPAYTMTGNTFNLTAGITNNSGVLQTFSNTGVVAVSGSTGGTVSNSTGLTLNGGTTWNVGTGGITVSGLQFSTTNNSSSTTTVNGTGGTLTIAYLGLGTMSSSRLVQTFNGTGNISIGTMVAGGSLSAATDSFTYSGTGTFSLTGSHTDTFGDTINSGTFNLSGTLGASLNVNNAAIFNLSGTLSNNLSVNNSATFTETSSGVMSGGATLTQNSTGTSTLSGSNLYTGATTVNAGTLLLDHSASGAPATNIIGGANTALTLAGGTLSIKGNSGATNSDKFNGTTIGSATALTESASELSFNQNGATSLGLTLGGLTRNAGSILDITLPTAGSVTTTSTTFASSTVLVSAASNGIAFATVNGGAAWATNTSGGTIGVLTPTASTYGSTANTSVGVGDTASTGANTLTFNGAGDSVAFTGTNTITTGGILITPSATGATAISGGTIQAGGGKELVVINNEATGSGALTISSTIQNNSTASALTIGGVGETILSASNSYTGQTTLLGGTLDLANSFALGSAGTLQVNSGSSLIFDQLAAGNAFTLGA